MSIRIDRHDDIYIAPAVRRDIPGHIDAADINIKGLVYILFFFFLSNLCLDPVLIYDLYLI